MSDARRRILIADDEEGTRLVLARLLGEGPYEVLTAKDGEEAVRLAAARSPDLILLDVNMPGLGGMRALEALRRDPGMRMTPVILVSGNGAAADRVSGLDRGADDYVVKPFEAGELRARVESLLRRHRRDVGANPLTGLPGSPSIEEEVRLRLESGEAFAFLYIDIDRFKPYNDVYGYARGDALIRETGRLLVESLGAEGGGKAFAGHIGGDDFAALCAPEDAAAAAARLCASFDRVLRRFLDREDRRRGRLEAKDRRGQPEDFAFPALSVAVVDSRPRVLSHYARVAEIASELKRYLKSDPDREGSRFLVDRRSDLSR